MNAPLVLPQAISLLLYSVSLGILVSVARGHPRWRLLVPPITWVVHVILFYVASLLRQLIGAPWTLTFFTIWGIGVHLHAAITLSVGLLIYRDKLSSLLLYE